MNKRIKTTLSVAVKLALVAAVVWTSMRWSRYDGSINALHVDLSAPDAFISSPALSRLPRDLVQAPLARELLTEDFAFYYEEQEDRLGVAGAIKRIAYEHDTTIADQLLALVLDEPAEVALWTDAKGAPRHWLIAMTRGALARIAQGAAPIFSSDNQLSAIGDLPDAPGASKVIALSVSPRRTFAIVAQGERVVVLSDPGLLFDAQHQADPASAKVVASLLSGDVGEQAVLRQRFGLGAPGARHVLAADSSLLSLGYRQFFPGLRGLALEVTPGGGPIRTRLRVADGAVPNAPADAALWAGMPMGPAACGWLPADWSRASALLAQVPEPGATPANDDEAASAASAPPSPSAASKAWSERFAAGFDGPAAICWYARSQLQTPVVVARMRPDVAPALADDMLGRLAAWLMPDEEPAEEPDAQSNGQSDGQSNEQSNKQPTARAPGASGTSRRWQREVPAPYGYYGADDTSLYRPTLARQGAWVTFSPDDALVDLALATQVRRYPSVADTLPAGGTTLAVIQPRPLADLLQHEMLAVLPKRDEYLRQAADAQLVPRLATLRNWPAVRAVPSGRPDANGWVDVDWQAMPAAAGRP